MTQIDTERRRLLLTGIAGAVSLLAGRALAQTPAPPSRIRVPKKVFAHYMVCCPANGGGSTVEDYKKEITSAQSRGLDGFALNCGGWNEGGSVYKPRCVLIYEAAKQLGTGFDIFISMDYCCINGMDQTRDALETFGGHPNQFKVGGKPVFSTYGGEGHTPQPAQEKIALVHKLGGFFVPFFYPTNYGSFDDANVAEILKDYGDVDGFFYFGGGGDGNHIGTMSRRLAQAWHGAGKIFMAPVTPYYRSFGGLSETYGFTSMAQEWEIAIQENADWVEIVTWNDFEEKTYVAPFGPPSNTKIWNGNDDGTGPILYSHVAYLDASRYYIDWFKSGKQPRITEDKLFYFYRTEPKAAAGKQLMAMEIQHGVKAINGADKLEDSVFVTTFLTKPAKLTIDSGGTSQSFDIPAGVHHTDMPFALGTQRFRLSRHGRTLMDKVGEQQIADQQGETRYNYFAGEAASEEKRK